MADYLIQDTTLDAIANAINAKTGGSSAMTPAQMVTAIAAIPSGGGGGLDDYFTAVNCVTILNNASAGYANGFVVYGVRLADIKKIEIRFKWSEQNPTHFIWLTAGIASGAPFFDKASGGGSISVTVNTNEVVDGITHYVLSIDTTSTAFPRIGSWQDSTYSKTAAYYELKMWDSSDNLIVDMQPSVSVETGDVSFLNRINGYFAIPSTEFVAGEVLS